MFGLYMSLKKMADNSQETIASRFIRLNQLILGRSHQDSPGRNLVHRDALLDAIFALYEECNTDYMRKDRYIAAFVDKIRILISELKRIRVSLNDFEVKKIIGRGHFGEVQVVREKVTGNVYAMKVLRKAETLSQQTVAFYEEEKDIMAKSASAWLTKLQYAFQDNQNLYLVMEFHPGGDMLSLLEKYDNVLPEDMARFYLAELVLAIQSVHNMGYVHRDIKPDNILFDRTGHIKLADFGSAAKLNSQKLVTSRMPVGTPDYIAPEVLIAMNCGPSSVKHYGVECDWWSLGIVAYEMLFGCTPFSDEKVLMTYNNIMNYKKCLNFPEEASEVSKIFIDVIKDLLQDSIARLGYEQLISHHLFVDIDWNNIRQTPPPYVPTVTSQDDTSNFDDFEPEKRPCVREVNTKKEFSGKNFSFIGFTYTSPFESLSERLSSSFDGSLNSPARQTADEQFSRKKEFIELQNKVSELSSSEAAVREKFEKLQKSCKSKDKKLENYEKEQEALESVIAQMESENKHLRRLLDFERKDRLLTEKKAVEMIRCMKEYSKSERFLYRNISDEQKKKVQDSSTVEQQLHDALLKMDQKDKEIESLGKELNNINTLLSQCQEKLTQDAKKNVLNAKQSLQSKIEESDESVSLLKEKVNSFEEENERLKTLVDQLESECNELKEELVKTTEMKTEAVEQMEALKTVVVKLENDLCQAEKDGLRAGGDTQVTSAITRLEKELNEKHNKIAELQTQLMHEQEKSCDLQSQLQVNSTATRLKSELKEKNSEIAELRTQLLNEQGKSHDLQSQLQEVENNLQLISAIKESLEKQVKTLEEKETGLSKQIKDLQNDIANCKEKFKKYEDNLDSGLPRDLASDIYCSETVTSVSETSSDALENNYIEIKIKHLELQNQILTEEVKNKQVKLSETEKQIKRLEKEVSDAKLDLRVVTREKKQEGDIASALRDSNRSLREKVSNSEKLIAKMERVEKDLKENVSKLEKELAEKQRDLEERDKMFQIEKAKLEERVKAMQDVCEATKNLNKEVAKSQGQYEEITKQNEDLKSQCQYKDMEKSQVIAELQAVKVELNAKKAECCKYEKIISALKETCTAIEDEVKDFQFIVESQSESLSIANKEKASLKKEIEKLQNDVKHLDLCLGREKESRMELEQQVEALSEEIDTQQALHEAEVRNLQDQLNEQKAVTLDLGDQVTSLERSLSVRDHNNKTHERKTVSLEEEVVRIKEEAAKYITQISSLKSSNMKLTQALEEAVENQKLAQDTMDQLHIDLESSEVAHNHEKLKLEETISQQIKLIDFLQSKQEGLEKKRKSYGVPRLFGKKDTATNPVPLQWRDMETLLDKERSKSRRLQDQLNQAKAEVMALRNDLSQCKTTSGTAASTCIPMSPLSRAMHSALTLSPSSNVDSDGPSSALSGTPYKYATGPYSERMKHKIPHRFLEALCMRGTKCCVCLDSIHFGRPASKCQECGVICHPKCSSSLPSTCGLPSELVKHFASSVKNHPSPKTEEGTEYANPESWIKVLRSNKLNWDHKYLRLIGTKLCFFENGEEINDKNSSDHVDLSFSDGEVTVISAVSVTELPGVATSDLPYIFKVEFRPYTTCWPSRCLHLMTKNFGEKKMWVSVLEDLIKQQKSLNGRTQENKLVGISVMKLKGEKCLDVNCVFSLTEEILLLGSMEGLFVANFDEDFKCCLRQKIEGIGSVYQIGISPKIGIVALITGGTRSLNIVEMNTIDKWIRNTSNLPPVQMESFPDCKTCHLFSIQDVSDSGGPHLCAATSNAIFLYKWNNSHQEFLKIKAFETKEPCSCIHFTQNSLIIGADTFYEFDLKTYAYEDFLDGTDAGLAGLVYGASQYRSFPIALFQVNEDISCEEYLLCFHEMGVFVDGFGQRTRQDDMKWTRLPLAFAFRSPYLFIMHFNTVEVIEILPSESTEIGIHAVMEVPSPLYLGPALEDGAIYLASHPDQCVEILHVHGNLVKSRHSSISSKESVVENDFSFSTSLLQSLDATTCDNVSVTSDVSALNSVSS